MRTAPIVRPGHNAWCIAHTHQLTFLIDGAAYFAAFMAAVRRARRAVYILGWDVDGRTLLDPNVGLRLVDLLNQLVTTRDRLHVYVLTWEHAFIYVREREPFAGFRFSLHSHRRLHFHQDGEHPMGASHHQKVVVVDDALALCGGVDLCDRRWDTPAHRPNDLARVDARHEPYAPIHDLGALMSGASAQRLGELCRERWRAATREQLPVPDVKAPWPSEVRPTLEDIDVGIARTLPATGTTAHVHEVERLFLDGIARAERFIYIENQYLSSSAIGAALCTSLRAERGPEIVIVTPRACSSWLEEGTMGVLRARLLRALSASDRYGRLRVYWPSTASGQAVNVHSKLFIADDQLIHLGSANLANRSMRLDSECDIVVEARGRQDVEGAIRELRNRLLGEHLDCSPALVEQRAHRAGSLLVAIDDLRRKPRTLEPLVPVCNELVDELLPDTDLIDPKHPLKLQHILIRLVPASARTLGSHPLLRVIVTLSLLLILAAALHWTSLSDGLSLTSLTTHAAELRSSALGLPFTVAVFVAGNLVLVPLTLLIVQAGVVFGPALGALYALIAALVSAAVVYWIGRLLGHAPLRRLLHRRIPSLARPCGSRSVFIVAGVRIFPTAPFTLVNLLVGASHVRFRHFMLGSLVGLTPGILLLTFFGAQLGDLLRAPTLASALLSVLVLGAVVFAGMYLRRRVFRAPVPGDASVVVE